jgi:hypothetical protein
MCFSRSLVSLPSRSHCCRASLFHENAHVYMCVFGFNVAIKFAPCHVTGCMRFFHNIMLLSFSFFANRSTRTIEEFKCNVIYNLRRSFCPPEASGFRHVLTVSDEWTRDADSVTRQFAAGNEMRYINTFRPPQQKYNDRIPQY